MRETSVIWKHRNFRLLRSYRIPRFKKKKKNKTNKQTREFSGREKLREEEEKRERTYRRFDIRFGRGKLLVGIAEIACQVHRQSKGLACVSKVSTLLRFLLAIEVGPLQYHPGCE
ncbi:uncharacterized protein LOC130780320 [Actinidia eriantha]|uniref:uncharacterized protein LOC130780320 n=1 Tax=Actinidia eriantha TaxID=165200 RepID=UPI00258AFEEA|nr:uncharacterized protein LOC130780320 [Actinidia eriantha]